MTLMNNNPVLLIETRPFGTLVEGSDTADAKTLTVPDGDRDEQREERLATRPDQGHGGEGEGDEDESERS